MKVVTTLFKTCGCGAMVALVRSERTGNLYAVEIGDDGVSTGQHGEKVASVESTDFHQCGFYPGVAQFIGRAIETGASQLRIRLITARNDRVLLSWTEGRWSKWIYVSDGLPRDEQTSHGRIEVSSGAYVAPDEGISADVLELLQAVSDDPLNAARAYGRATNECAFCGRNLRDERSIEMGYGPDCAKRYQLEWGEEGESTPKRAKRTRNAVGLTGRRR